MRWEGGNVELHSDLSHTREWVRVETVSSVIWKGQNQPPLAQLCLGLGIVHWGKTASCGVDIL